MFTLPKKKKVKGTIKAVQPTKKDKDRSKGRSVSITKSRQNIRLPTKPDVIQQDIRPIKHKAFMSLNEQVDNNTTAKHNFQSICQPEPRRRRTPQRKRNKTNSSHSQLMRLQPRKRQVHSAMENKRKSKDKLKPKKPKLPTQHTTLLRKPKLHIDIDDLQQLQLANRDHLMSVTSSGEIVFSSRHESKHSELQIQQPTLLSKQQFEVDPQALLRIHLKKEYKKKVAAVIKIQKIWRGYQTRKLLDKFIRDAIKDYKDKSEQNFQDFAPMKRSPKRDQQSLSFNTGKISSDYADLADCSEIKMSEVIPPINQINLEPEQDIVLVGPQILGSKETIEPKPEITVPEKKEEPIKQPRATQKQSNNESPQQVGYQQQDQFDQQSNQDDDLQDCDAHLYRHQRPIYSYQDIHEYLQNSQKQRQEQDDQDSEQEIDYYDQRYEQYEVIVETNQEYLDSRKNSTHTKKNKTIESRKTSKDRDELFQVRKFSKESKEEVFERRISKEIQIRHVDVELPKSPLVLVQESIGKENQQLSSNKIELIENPDNESTKSDYKQEVARIKKQEIDKWARMIDLIKGNLKKSGVDSDMESLLNQIVQQSEQNKKRLEEQHKDGQTLQTRLTTHDQQMPSKPKFTFQQPQPQQPLAATHNQKSQFRKKHLQLDIDNIQGTYKKQPAKQILQVIKSRSDDSRLSNQMKINWNLQTKIGQSPLHSNNNKAQLKQLLQQKLLNLSSSNLNDIISIREQMLKQRKISEQDKLRMMLHQKKIELAEFEQRVADLMDYIDNERADIERAKKDIEKGLRVAAQVAVKSQRDARWLGKSLGLSKSAEQLRRGAQLLVPFESKIVFVDEMPRRVQQRNVNFFGEDSAESSESGDPITEEDIKSFKQPKYSNIEFNDMNKNIMIEEFLKSQKTENYKNHFKKQQPKIAEIAAQNQKNIEKKKEIIQETTERQKMQSHALRSQASSILDALIQKLLVQCCIDIMRRPCVFQTLSSKLGLTSNRPLPITRQQTLTFISLIESRLPATPILLQRLNQQISPPPLQLLKCMRVDFYEDEEMSQEELGKYEFVIPETSCNEAIREMTRAMTEAAPIRRAANLDLMMLEPDAREFVDKRERLWQRRQQDLRNRRAEVLNIEMHCVFDCWNEQIITIKSQLPGYSGIGLNEPTLALKDHNKPVASSQVNSYLTKSKDKLLQIVLDDSDIVQKISAMSFEQMCYNDCSWICYTDESLGFVLELDYIIGEELMAEVARFLHRQMVRQTLIIGK